MRRLFLIGCLILVASRRTATHSQDNEEASPQDAVSGSVSAPRVWPPVDAAVQGARASASPSSRTSRFTGPRLRRGRRGGRRARRDVNTLFQAASISKPVTAMAALRARAGRASSRSTRHQLDPQVMEGPGERPHQGAARHGPRSLMSHTSGADDGFGFPGYEPSAPRPTLVQILERREAIQRRPGPFRAPAATAGRSIRAAASRSCSSRSPTRPASHSPT